MRQEIAYGENLSLARRYETELGSSSFRIVDVVTNEGWFETPHQLLYHFNLGYPLVDDGARGARLGAEEPDVSRSRPRRRERCADRLAHRDRAASRASRTRATSSRCGPDADGRVAVALVNRAPRPIGGLGVYLRYDARAAAGLPRLADDARGPVRDRPRAGDEPVRQPGGADRAGLPAHARARARAACTSSSSASSTAPSEIDAFAESLP